MDHSRDEHSVRFKHSRAKLYVNTEDKNQKASG